MTIYRFLLREIEDHNNKIESKQGHTIMPTKVEIFKKVLNKLSKSCNAL